MVDEGVEAGVKVDDAEFVSGLNERGQGSGLPAPELPMKMSLT
jgi:hypothetical protein